MAVAETKGILRASGNGKITHPSKLVGWLFFCVIILFNNLAFLSGSEFPMGVVSSSSMEPTISRGDMVFLSSMTSGTYKTGDIVVYRTPKDGSLIIHRVIEIHSVANTTDCNSICEDHLLLTKGDNNLRDDVELYGLDWLDRKLVVGKVRGVLPYIGYVWIVLSD